MADPVSSRPGTLGEHPAADGAGCHTFDVRYVEGVDLLDDEEFGLVVDGKPSTLRFAGGTLVHTAGTPADPTLVVTTTGGFMDRWAAGDLGWDEGVASGEVTLTGDAGAWSRWAAASSPAWSAAPGTSSSSSRPLASAS